VLNLKNDLKNIQLLTNALNKAWLGMEVFCSAPTGLKRLSVARVNWNRRHLWLQNVIRNTYISLTMWSAEYYLVF